MADTEILTEEAARLLTKENRIYVVSTGAGAGLQRILWDVPGISKVLVGAEFPYAKEATDRFLGFEPESYCSEETAVAMAMEAYYRAFQPGGAPAIGLGIAASVASNTEHRGEHRVFVACMNDETMRTYSGILVKGHGPGRRRVDGNIADMMGLFALLDRTKAFVTPKGPLQAFIPEQGRDQDWYRFPDWMFQSYEENGMAPLIAAGLIQKRPLFKASGARLSLPTSGNGMTLFPGAFNPPHEGHLWLGRENNATFHITINPPHKPALSVAEVLQRAKMLEGFDRLFTVNDPLYIEKARCFPGAKFIVGSDALIRMLDPKWGPDPVKMMDEFRHLGVRFLVADREDHGAIVSLDDIPNAPRDICTRIMRPAQHLGLSSTKLREAKAGNAA